MSSITQELAAQIAGFTTRHLRRITKEPDSPPQNPDGSYPAAEFGKWLKRRHIAGLGVANDGTVYDFGAERARLTHHQANVERLKELQLRGELIHRDVVAAYWQAVAGAIRSRLLALPGKIAHVALAAKTLAEVDDAAKLQVYEALSELGTNGLPDRYAVAEASPGPSVEPASEADSEPVGGRKPPAKRRGKRGAGTVAH